MAEADSTKDSYYKIVRDPLIPHAFNPISDAEFAERLFATVTADRPAHDLYIYAEYECNNDDCDLTSIQIVVTLDTPVSFRSVAPVCPLCREKLTFSRHLKEVALTPVNSPVEEIVKILETDKEARAALIWLMRPDLEKIAREAIRGPCHG
jgi:hypothetical protein